MIWGGSTTNSETASVAYSPSGRAVERELKIPEVLLIVLLFGCSGGMLWSLGVNYEGVTGSAPSKIHPFTYFVILLIAWQALRSGSITNYCVHAAQRTPASILLVGAGVALFCQIVSRNGAGMAGAIDTFVGPGLLVILLVATHKSGLRSLEVTLHALMTCNAVLAIFEFLTDSRLFPYRFDGELFPNDARSTALQGHPLTNATVTACYLLALINGGYAFSGWLKALLVGLQFVALVTFGGRSAIIVVLILAAFYIIMKGKHLIRGVRISLATAAIVSLLVTLTPIVLVPPLSGGGLFDSLIMRFESDGGSANARLEMFNLFFQIPIRDLLIGPDLDLIESLRRVSGLEWGIENPIVKTVLYQGVCITLLLTIAVVFFLREIAMRCERGVWLPLLAFSILLMTAETIGGKTTMLAKFAAIALTMYRCPTEPSIVRHGETEGLRNVSVEGPS